LAGALREFTEETGFAAQGPFIALQPVRQRAARPCRLRLRGGFRPEEIRQQHLRDGMAAALGKRASPEIDRVGWFGFDEAMQS
jgi:predicted NUDIX family NTP pyrophosphohydrolase